MGLRARIYRQSSLRADAGPTDDYWYYSAERLGGGATYTGFPISPETATRVSAVHACVEVLAVTLASLPLHLYRRLADGGKERATDHPLYPVLARRPNQWQTRFEFIEYLVRNLFLRGGGYAQKDVATNSLIPVHPDRVTIEQLASTRLRYKITPKGGVPYTVSQDGMLHVRDTSDDALAGVSRTYLAREAIAVAAAAEAMSARFLKNDGSGRVVATHLTRLDDKTRAEFHRAYQDNRAGWDNRSKMLLAEGGVGYTILPSLGDSGFLVDPRKFQIADICRFFGRVPPFMIGHEDKITWGTNVEQIKSGFVAFCAQPVGNRLEQALQRDLLTEDEQDEYFIAFTYEELLRGDLLATVQALAVERQNGALSPNEWRAIRNRNPREDEGGDTFQATPVGGAPNAPEGTVPPPANPPAPPPDDTTAVAIPAPLLADAAQRIASGEVEQVRKRGEKAASDGMKFAGWARGYFIERRAYVLKVLEPIVQSFGLESWQAEAAATRIEQTAIRALGADGIPAGWCEAWPATVETILTETFSAGMARAA